MPPAVEMLSLNHWTAGETPKMYFIKQPFCNNVSEVKLLSPVQLSATPWTATHQALPSLGFSRQEYWSGLLFHSPMHESEK